MNTKERNHRDYIRRRDDRIREKEGLRSSGEIDRRIKVLSERHCRYSNKATHEYIIESPKQIRLFRKIYIRLKKLKLNNAEILKESVLLSSDEFYEKLQQDPKLLEKRLLDLKVKHWPK